MASRSERSGSIFGDGAPVDAAPEAELVPTAPAQAVPATVPAQQAVYVVAKGHSVTTLRGQLNAGATIAPRDFPAGGITFETLRKSNIIVEKK